MVLVRVHHWEGIGIFLGDAFRPASYRTHSPYWGALGDGDVWKGFSTHEAGVMRFA
jgi:hypothetical protein